MARLSLGERSFRDLPQEHEVDELFGQIWVDAMTRDEDAIEEPMLVWVRRDGNVWNTGRGPGYRVVVADGRDKPAMRVSLPIPVGAGPRSGASGKTPSPRSWVARVY
jgi:hypothetical protein